MQAVLNNFSSEKQRKEEMMSKGIEQGGWRWLAGDATGFIKSAR